MNIRVALVEDNERMREALQLVINGSPGFACATACGSTEEALQALPKAPPDVVLMDVNLPGRSGIECVRELKRLLPRIQIVMLTIESESRRVFESLAAGATGYLVKNLPPAQLLAAIEEVHRGGSPMSSQIARMLVQSFHRPAAAAVTDADLSQREEDILKLVAQGYRSKEVGEQLGIAASTVATHLRNIYEKLHVRSRTEAIIKYLGREG